MRDPFKELCRLAGTAVVRYRMIADGDRVLVGLSGGKDSTALLRVLLHLRAAAPIDFELVAATVDPGWEGFNADASARLCRELGVEHHRVALPIAGILAEKQAEDSPCVLCSRLRRGHLYRLGRELGCGKLALGQHLDDLAVSFLMSLCRGQGLRTMAPMVPSASGSDNPAVIRPLALAPESLIAECAAHWELPRAGACRYRETLENGDRLYFRKLLDTLSERIPGVRSNILHSLGKVERDHLL